MGEREGQRLGTDPERQRASAAPMVKICGLTRNEDAVAAEKLGADLLGVVLTPGFRRSVARSAAAAVVAGTTVPKVAVLVDESPERAVAAARSIGATILQLHGEEDRAAVRALRERGEWTLWKAVRARSPSDVRAVADRLGDDVDGILVEGWREGVTGGGGARLELEAEEVRSALPREVRFVLAGGLEPGSVRQAVARFGPDVVDVSSGVEREVGRKDPALVAAFVRAARGARTPG